MASQYSLKVKGRQPVPADLANSVSALVEEAGRLQHQLNQLADEPAPQASQSKKREPISPETALKLEEIKRTLQRLSAQPVSTSEAEAAVTSEVDRIEADLESLLERRSPAADQNSSSTRSPLQRAVNEILDKQQQLTRRQSEPPGTNKQASLPRIRLSDPKKAEKPVAERPSPRRADATAKPADTKPVQSVDGTRIVRRPQRPATPDLDARFAHLTEQINKLGAAEQLTKVEKISTGMARKMGQLDQQINKLQDGLSSLTEAVDANGVAFSYERVRALLEKGGPVDVIENRIRTALETHLGGEALEDDFSLVLLRRRGNVPPPPPPAG